MEQINLAEIKTNSKIRALLIELPVLCGCNQAERLKEIFKYAYDSALVEGTPFDRTEDDVNNPGSRLWCVNPLNFNPKNQKIAAIGFSRLVIAEYAVYLKKGYITQEFFNVVKNMYSSAKENCVEIDNILTYEEAVNSQYWWW